MRFLRRMLGGSQHGGTEVEYLLLLQHISAPVEALVMTDLSLAILGDEVAKANWARELMSVAPGIVIALDNNRSDDFHLGYAAEKYSQALTYYINAAETWLTGVDNEASQFWMESAATSWDRAVEAVDTFGRKS